MNCVPAPRTVARLSSSPAPVAAANPRWRAPECFPPSVEHEVDRTVAGWRHLAFTPGEVATIGNRGSDSNLDSSATRIYNSGLIAGLATQLANVLPSLREDQGTFADFTECLGEKPNLAWRQFVQKALNHGGEGQCGETRLILLVDQLEELFTSSEITETERDAFANALEALVRSGSIWVLATMRSDFTHLCQNIAALLRMREGMDEIDLPPPGSDAIARVIRDPARLAGLRYEERDGRRLDDVLLREATEHRELLPFLSHVLRRLCEKRREDGVLTFAVWEDNLGGDLRQALAKYADSVFAELPSEARAALPDAWSRLVGLEGNRTVRRYARRDLTQSSALRELVENFIVARLFTASSGADDATITVAHETLIQTWNRANEWVAANRDHLRMKANVESFRKRWDTSHEDCGKRDRSLLLPPGIPLQEGRVLRDLAPGMVDDETLHYIAVSASTHHRRKTLRYGWTIIAFMLLLLIRKLNSRHFTRHRILLLGC